MIRKARRVASRLKRVVRDRLEWAKEWKLPRNAGYCTVCEAETVFVEYDRWLRDFYRCLRCKSIPRNRALVNALNRFAPVWRTLSLHESSPGGAMSAFLKRSCAGYSSSHYYADV